MAPTSVATEAERLRKVASEAFLRIEAAFPQLNSALEELGDGEAARQFALALWAIEGARDMLKPVFEGGV